jgi:hypothetical protein
MYTMCVSSFGAQPAHHLHITAKALAQLSASFLKCLTPLERLSCCHSRPRRRRETVTLSKRLLIEGEGQPGETFIDQRANNPTFRILRRAPRCPPQQPVRLLELRTA